MNVFFARNGRMYEYDGYSKEFFQFLARRSAAFLIDFVIIVGVIFGFTTYLTDPLMKYLVGSMLAIVFAATYNLISMYFMKGQTVGMKIAGIITMNFTGEEPKRSRVMAKAFINGMYFFPFIGIGILASSVVTPVLMRGSTLIDVWTRTTVITVKLYNHIIEEENKILEKERKENE